MDWMTRWPGPFPIYFAEAEGTRVVDVDGVEYADLPHWQFSLTATDANRGFARPPLSDPGAGGR